MGKDGDQTYVTELFNLDIIISVGYRVKSQRGTPSVAVPKIFIRYYLVNTATGEKSGTMLAECKWTAGE